MALTDEGAMSQVAFERLPHDPRLAIMQQVAAASHAEQSAVPLDDDPPEPVDAPVPSLPPAPVEAPDPLDDAPVPLDDAPVPLDDAPAPFEPPLPLLPEQIALASA
jgi:hypothetical protein